VIRGIFQNVTFWQHLVWFGGLVVVLSFCVIVISSTGRKRRCPPELEDSSKYTE
jgi:hypothetical protein